MGAGALEAYVSRGILACARAGDRDMLHSRHRVTTVFRREAQASGRWCEGILSWVELGSGWTLGGPGKVPLLRSGQGEQGAASDPELCLPRSLARPRAFCLPGRGESGVPQPAGGSWLRCPACVWGSLLCPAEGPPYLSIRLPGERLVGEGATE